MWESILEWTRELECLRAKCKNIQGKINRRMKRNIVRIQEGISVLISRVTVTGDPVFLRMRHREMAVRIKELERENERLEDRIKRMLSPSSESFPLRRFKTTATLNDVMKMMMAGAASSSMMAGTSSMSKTPEKKRKGRERKLIGGNVLWETPLPQRSPRVKSSDNAISVSNVFSNSSSTLNKERQLTKQIERLAAERKALRELRRDGDTAVKVRSCINILQSQTKLETKTNKGMETHGTHTHTHRSHQSNTDTHSYIHTDTDTPHGTHIHSLIQPHSTQAQKAIYIKRGITLKKFKLSGRKPWYILLLLGSRVSRNKFLR